MQEIPGGSADVAHDHEAECEPHLSREQIDGQKIEAEIEGAAGERFDRAIFSG